MTGRPLNDRMEFDHVIQVHEDGSITDEPTVHAPELYDGELTASNWTLLRGYSGQESHPGPIMHASEFIGGRMAEDIRVTPGYYVALVNGTLDDSEEGEGWAVAYRESL